MKKVKKTEMETVSKMNAGEWEGRIRTRTVKTSVRVPMVTWERVKILAIRRGVTAQALIQEAIESLLKGDSHAR